VTLVYGVLSCERDLLTLGVAGHPPPLLVPSDGPPRALAERLGPALGLGAGPWPEQQVRIDPRSTVLAFSDGVVQGRDVDLFEGMERLRASLAEMPAQRRRPRDVCARAAAMRAQFAGVDDVTMLAIACAPGAQLRTARIELPQDPVAATTARRFARATLDDWGLDDVQDQAQLAVSELVTNAVMHGGASITVTLECEDDLLTLVVEDRGGRGVVQPGDLEDPAPVSGRGLLLVQAMSSAWGSEQTPDRTTVWCEFALSSDHASGESVQA
jgi:anti-sigma regulatory factor (Ser/Thr protein kinase)